MTISSGPFTYDWQADWADIPVSPAHAHHGLAVLPDGNILTGHAAEPKCILLTPEGKIIREFAVPTRGTHGLTCSMEDGRVVVWITDVEDPQVVKTNLDGQLLARLTKADFPLGDDTPFCPTATAVDPVTGEVWVTDGYGSHTVHCFTTDLVHKLQLDDEKGLGAFENPHGVFVDRRRDQSRIYVADRVNNRVQVFNPDGSFSHGIEEGLHTPSVFDTFGEYLVIGELEARIHILDREDRIVATLGDGRQHVEKPGWPNRLDADGNPDSPLDDIPEGELNSPHGVCADEHGNIYISEWLIGDRYTKLARV
ncbi:MAG: hypothetical protein DRP64_10190 [Verrucomicrobia bacterium]|nr:MAG: hypothetical protein DRP64_10190 [Verrucomicrobiota bacterium]